MSQPFMNLYSNQNVLSLPNNLSLLALYLLLVCAAFFILSALIMVTYNNSITKMNNNWKTINYKDSMVFTLFLIFVGGLFSSTVYIR